MFEPATADINTWPLPVNRVHTWWQRLIIVMAMSSLAFSPVAKADNAHRKDEPGLFAWAEFVEPDFPFFSSVVDARELGGGWPTNNLTPARFDFEPGK